MKTLQACLTALLLTPVAHTLAHDVPARETPLLDVDIGHVRSFWSGRAVGFINVV